jgi:hypothetical protein
MGEAAAFDINLALNSMYILGTLTSWACESFIQDTRNRSDSIQSCTALEGEQSTLPDRYSWQESSVLLVFLVSSKGTRMPHMVLDH